MNHLVLCLGAIHLVGELCSSRARACGLRTGGPMVGKQTLNIIMSDRSGKQAQPVLLWRCVFLTAAIPML